MRLWLVGGLLLIILALPYGYSERRTSIGSKKFTESVILGEMLRQLAEDANAEASHYRELGGTTLVYQALLSGEIDVYPEYTGTIREEILGLKPSEDDTILREQLRQQGIGISEPLGFNNTYAIGMLRQRAEQLGIKTLSDLTRHPEIVFGLSNEFLERKDGWPGLKARYQLAPGDVTGLDQDLAYQQLLVGSIDCMDVYSTDAKLKEFDVVALQDDLNYFPGYDAVLLYRTALETENPELIEAWLSLENAIDRAHIIEANATVELGGASEAQAAADFLEEQFGIQNLQKEAGIVKRVSKTSWEHLQLVRRSLFPAILLAIPLGVLAFRFASLGRLILAIVSVVQTIPSLALLVMLIPLMSFLGFRSVGLGSASAIIALFLYSLLPIVRNVHSGLKSISNEHLEAARGLGLTSSQRLFSVELPLAWTNIISGIKTAAVLNVGFATLGALIGAGGYGQPILSGIRLNDTQLILEGALPAALLALCVQYGFDVLENLTTPRGLKHTN